MTSLQKIAKEATEGNTKASKKAQEEGAKETENSRGTP